jgi:hypothetical protein
MQYSVFLISYSILFLLFWIAARLLGYPLLLQLSTLDYLMLAMATFRLTELISEEKVAKVIRAPFCEERLVEQPDGTQVMEEVPRGTGLRRTCGEMLLCPWCTGVWIATLLTFFRLMLPFEGRILVLVFAVAAGGLLFQILVKLMDRARTSIQEPDAPAAEPRMPPLERRRAA